MTDEVWITAEPLLPRQQVGPNRGRPRVDDRTVLAGMFSYCAPGLRASAAVSTRGDHPERGGDDGRAVAHVYRQSMRFPLSPVIRAKARQATAPAAALHRLSILRATAQQRCGGDSLRASLWLLSPHSGLGGDTPADAAHSGARGFLAALAALPPMSDVWCEGESSADRRNPVALRRAAVKGAEARRI